MKAEIIKRYALFFFSVVLQGIAIASITYADIGTTPISSTNYVLSLHSDFTLGDTTFIFNVLLIVLQVMFIYIGPDKIKDHLSKLLMQIPVLFIFSGMIDFATYLMQLCLPENINYIGAWVLVIFGTVLLALAVSLSVSASVAMVPGEYFIKIFHPIVKKSFSFVKTFFDIFLVSSAVVLSLFLTNFTGIEGVREGTLFAALCTGPTVHFFLKFSKYITPFLSSAKIEEKTENVKAEDPAKE